MPFFGVPLNSQDVISWIFRAVGQLVRQTMAGSFESFSCFLIILLKSAAPLFANFVARVFNDHGRLPGFLCRTRPLAEHKARISRGKLAPTIRRVELFFVDTNSF